MRAIFTLPEYAQDLDIAQRFITPAINPFSAKNAELSERGDRGLSGALQDSDGPATGDADLALRPLEGPNGRHRGLPQGTRAGRLHARPGRQHAPATIRKAKSCSRPSANSIDERVIVVTVDDPLLVNALQRRAAVVLQKSTREGFGLTVTEAMWKGAAVIGGNVGGIRHQIRDGENGFLVRHSRPGGRSGSCSSCAIPRCASGSVRGRRETVRENFLMSRLLEDWLDLLAVHWRPARPELRRGARMRIAQIAPLAESVPPRLYGGTERVVAWLIEELVALGHDVTLFASGNSHTARQARPRLAARPAARPAAHRPDGAAAAACSKPCGRAAGISTSSIATSTGCPCRCSAASGVPFLTTMHGRLDIAGPARRRPPISRCALRLDLGQPAPAACRGATGLAPSITAFRRTRCSPASSPDLSGFPRPADPEKGPEGAMRIARGRRHAAAHRGQGAQRRARLLQGAARAEDRRHVTSG